MNRRPWRIWTVFICGLLAAAGGLAWMSRVALSLERKQAEAEAREVRESATRLALWRMDSILTPLLARESARPSFHYLPFHSPERAYTQMFAELTAGEVVIPSPLLDEPLAGTGDPAALVRLHFQIDARSGLTSPQAPTGNMRDLAEARYIPADRVIDAGRRLERFEAVLLRAGILVDVTLEDVAAAKQQRGVIPSTRREVRLGLATPSDGGFVGYAYAGAPGPTTTPNVWNHWSVGQEDAAAQRGEAAELDGDTALSFTLGDPPAEELAGGDAAGRQWTSPPVAPGDYVAREQVINSAKLGNRAVSGRNPSRPQQIAMADDRSLPASDPGPGERAQRAARQRATQTDPERLGSLIAGGDGADEARSTPSGGGGSAGGNGGGAPGPGQAAGAATASDDSAESIALDLARTAGGSLVNGVSSNRWFDHSELNPTDLFDCVSVGEGEPAMVGPLEPRWLPAAEPGGAPELILVRAVRVDGVEMEQGLWLDAEVLTRQLLAAGGELVAGARLEPILPEMATAQETDGETSDGARIVPASAGTESPALTGSSARLAAVPLALVRPTAGPARIEGLTVVRGAVGGAWLALLVAAAAIGFMLHALLALAARREQFVSAVTHELRTPLTTFQLYSEMLAGDMVRDPETRRSYLETLHGESRRLGRIVENVLAFARLGKRQAREVAAAERSQTIFTDAVERFAGDLAQRAERADMAFDLQVDESIAALRVAAPPDAIERILGNLVDNACVYGRPESGDGDGDGHGEHRARGRILIDVRRVGDDLCCTVADDGPGVPVSDVRSIFAPFRQGRDGASGGLGLGLALSRGLARSAGGDLKLLAAADRLASPAASPAADPVAGAVGSPPLAGAHFRLRLPILPG